MYCVCVNVSLTIFFFFFFLSTSDFSGVWLLTAFDENFLEVSTYYDRNHKTGKNLILGTFPQVQTMTTFSSFFLSAAVFFINFILSLPPFSPLPPHPPTLPQSHPAHPFTLSSVLLGFYILQSVCISLEVNFICHHL